MLIIASGSSSLHSSPIQGQLSPIQGQSSPTQGHSSPIHGFGLEPFLNKNRNIIIKVYEIF